MAIIQIPTPLRTYTKGNKKVEVNGKTVGEVIRNLTKTYPDLRSHVLNEDESIRSYLKIFKGDRDIAALEEESTPIDSDTELSIIPAIAGGTQQPGEGEFSKEELERYSRHLILPSFNIEGQRKLKHARVLVVGSGGLGSPLLLYLAAAGVGTIGIVDFDRVDETNLQRQVLFTVDDVGRKKTSAARDRIQALNPHIEIKTYDTRLSSDNALEIIEGYDVVADGTDNFPTRYLVNDACVLLDIPNVYASIYRFEGQLSVFNFIDSEGNRGPNYRDLFPTPPPPELVPSCAEGGVLGVLPGMLGTMQANEVIKVAAGIGEPLSGTLLTLDALTFETNTYQLIPNTDRPPIEELIDYEQFCGVTPTEDRDSDHEEIKEITAESLASWNREERDYQLIDVREAYEYEISNLGADLIPLENIEEESDRIAQDKPVVIHCRSGQRSAEAIERLQDRYGHDNLYNLKGGILAYAEHVDPSLAKY